MIVTVAPRYRAFGLVHVETLRIFVNVPQTFVRSIAPGQPVQAATSDSC